MCAGRARRVRACDHGPRAARRQALGLVHSPSAGDQGAERTRAAVTHRSTVEAGEAVQEDSGRGELLRRNEIGEGLGPAMTFTAADIEAFKLAIEMKRERGRRE